MWHTAVAMPLRWTKVRWRGGKDGGTAQRWETKRETHQQWQVKEGRWDAQGSAPLKNLGRAWRAEAWRLLRIGSARNALPQPFDRQTKYKSSRNIFSSKNSQQQSPYSFFILTWVRNLTAYNVCCSCAMFVITGDKFFQFIGGWTEGGEKSFQVSRHGHSSIPTVTGVWSTKS